MSLMSRDSRAIFCAATRIDRLIVDRACDAIDALVDRGDVDAYKRYMGTAIAQMGLDAPVRQQDRPTAVDVVKAHVLSLYADREHISNARAAKRVRRMLEG